MPSEKPLELRDRDTGSLVVVATPYEAQLLASHDQVEGVATKSGRLKFLKFTVETREAMRLLRRKLCASGRTVAEACHLTSRQNVPGGGVIYSHIVKRTNTYEPGLRQGQHPTYAALREAAL